MYVFGFVILCYVKCNHRTLYIPYSPNGKRNIRDPFKENIDSSRTVAMI